jgi:hypothetical protein
VKFGPPNAQSAIPRMTRYQQVCSSVSAGTSVSAGDPISANDLHLVQVRGGNIGCQWRAGEGGESPAGGEK